jgi:hypothetical protein
MAGGKLLVSQAALARGPTKEVEGNYNLVYYLSYLTEIPMKASLVLVRLALTLAAAPAMASSFDCVAPDLPERSVTREGVHRVQKQIKTWRACYAGQEAAGNATADAQKLNAEIDADIQKWMDGTRLASRSSASSAVLAQIEQERMRYLRLRQLR